jgi:hypothetical protein
MKIRLVTQSLCRKPSTLGAGLRTTQVEQITVIKTNNYSHFLLRDRDYHQIHTSTDLKPSLE